MFHHRHEYLSIRTKIMLCKTLLLSILFLRSLGRIRLVQNYSIRFKFRIWKCDHMSHKFNDIGWFIMKDRYKFHALCLFRKIITFRKHPYVNIQLNFKTDVHNMNIRSKVLPSCSPHKRMKFYIVIFSIFTTKFLPV